MTPAEIRNRLQSFIEAAGLKHWNRAAKRDIDFITAVNELSTEIADAPLPERILVAMGSSAFCERGQRRKFKRITDDWGFCGTTGKCACAAEHIAKTSRENVDHVARLAKTAATLEARYGSSNPGQTPTARAAHEAFYADPQKVKAASEKSRQTAITNDSYAARRQLAVLKKETRKNAAKAKIYTDPIPKDKIACAICNKALRLISPAHCSFHNITVAEYQERFPDAPLSCVDVTNARSVAAKGRILSDDHRRLISLAKRGHPRNGGDARTTAATLSVLEDSEQMRILFETQPIKTISAMLGVGETYLAAKCNEMGIHRFSSSVEQAVASMVIDFGFNPEMRTRSIISPQEIDIYVPEKKLAIEVCGLYYHSSLFKPDRFHYDKLLACEKLGLKLVTIFEDEVYDRPAVISSRLRNMLGLSPKGKGARKLAIRIVSREMANRFLDIHHIQGGSKANLFCYGAFDGEVLVAVMAFKPSWRARSKDAAPMELSRFATDGLTYAGLASRMFSAFVHDHNPNRVITYADRRWSEGHLYTQMGFEETKRSLPSYTYWRNGTTARLDKTKFRRQKIEGLVESGADKTEREIMTELKYHRIYDCGSIRFDWVR